MRRHKVDLESKTTKKFDNSAKLDNFADFMTQKELLHEPYQIKPPEIIVRISS